MKAKQTPVEIFLAFALCLCPEVSMKFDTCSPRQVQHHFDWGKMVYHKRVYKHNRQRGSKMHTLHNTRGGKKFTKRSSILHLLFARTRH